MKNCSMCKNRKKIIEFYKNQNYCKDCNRRYHKKRYKLKKPHHRKQQNEYRKTARYKELHNKDSRLNYLRNRKKVLARAKLNRAVKLGRIKKKPCWCGEIKSESHHEDYNKPLDVMWFCTKHHREYELKNGIDNR